MLMSMLHVDVVYLHRCPAPSSHCSTHGCCWFVTATWQSSSYRCSAYCSAEPHSSAVCQCVAYQQ